MTKQELRTKHAEEWNSSPAGSNKFFIATNVSIQYAISVLEDYRESIIKFIIGHSDTHGLFVTPENAREVWMKTKWDLELENKITELKSLLK